MEEKGTGAVTEAGVEVEANLSRGSGMEAGAEVREEAGEGTSYGKFRNGEELYKAYRALESEFTKRSQRLKELEAREGERRGAEVWTERVRALTREYPIASNYGKEIAAYFREAPERLGEENCLERALLAVLGKPKAKPSDAPLMAEGGVSSFAAPLKPRSIREAGELAVQWIEKNTRR